MKKRFLMAVIFAAALVPPGLAIYAARAQTGGGALVVATCGTLAQNFAVGSTRQLTVNASGQVCQ